jgi:hypothetical protein
MNKTARLSDVSFGKLALYAFLSIQMAKLFDWLIAGLFL